MMGTSNRTLEVCVDSVDSARVAIEAGAHRLELCSSLASTGGLTPTPGMLETIINMYSGRLPALSVVCMLRCRPGNFVYSPHEVEVMKNDAKALKKAGATGFAFGALTVKDDVDMRTCRDIILACFPVPVTFHRAFDYIDRPTIEIEVVIDLGFKRVLTSGQQPNAQLGVKLIRKIMDQAGSRIVIIPAGGITKNNISYIVEHTMAMEYHGTFKEINTNAIEKNGDLKKPDNDENSLLIPGYLNAPVTVTDSQHVSEVLHILKSI